MHHPKKVQYTPSGKGLLFFPDYDLHLTFAHGYGKILVKTTSPYTYKGYCGTRNYNKYDELTIPLSQSIYGSTEHVYSTVNCQGRQPRGLPFFTCDKERGLI